MKTVDLPISLEEENIQLKQAVKELLEQVNWLKQQLFGKKSERFIGENPNTLYFPGFEPEPLVEALSETVTIEAHEKRKAKATPINTVVFPEDLPVEEVIIDLPEEEKTDSVTGLSLVCIGEDVTTRLAKKAATYFLKRTVIKKYVLPTQPEEGVKTGEIPDSIIPRCAVDESILADVLVKKFCDHLPLYRQAEMMLRDGVKISRQTLSSYVVKLGQALKPVYDLLEGEIRESGNVFVDETPVDILAPGTGKTKQGYMVTMVGGKSLDPPLRIYKFFESRKHEKFEELFDGYIGAFHSDKYGAYEKEAKNEGKTWCPCWGHVRRKFFEAEGETSFRESVLGDIRELFALEEKAAFLGPEERVEMRKKNSIPLIDGLVEKMKNRLAGKILPRSKISQAIGYFLGLVPYLKNYVENPYARMDNNVAERALKLVVIGRKNWLFVGSEGGGEAAAIIYSLTQTCRALGINPYHYLEDVLRKIQGHTYNKLHELLPEAWKQR